MKNFAVLFVFITSCATDNKKTSQGKPEPVESKPTEKASAYSAEEKTLTQSFSNNPMTSKVINRQAAADLAEKSSGPAKEGNINAEVAFIAASRLAGKSLPENIQAARQLIDQIVKKDGVQREIPDVVELELAIHAVSVGKLAFAEHLYDRLLKSKNAKVRAGINNLIGVVALRLNKIPEAVNSFRQSLKEDGGYVAAKLNLGFLALRGGDFNLAKSMLNDMSDDWFVKSGVLIIDRMGGGTDQAAKLCTEVLAKKPNHKPTLFNCGLNEFQARKNYKVARDYMNKTLKYEGGDPSWNERAAKIIGEIDNQEAREFTAAEQAKKAETKPQPAKVEAGKSEAKPESGKVETPSDLNSPSHPLQTK